MLHGWIGSSDSIRERAEGENFQPFHFLHIIFLIRHFDKKRYRIPGLIMVPVFLLPSLKMEIIKFPAIRPPQFWVDEGGNDMVEEMNLTKDVLENMRNVDIKTVDKCSLVDINDVKIDESLPRGERVRNYIRQIGNPYCYLDHGVAVKISFSGKGSFEDILTKYLSFGTEKL